LSDRGPAGNVPTSFADVPTEFSIDIGPFVLFHTLRSFFMTAHCKFFPAVARCLLVSVPMAVLGPIWGCGGEIAPQASLDDATKAKVQESKDNMKDFMAKKAARQKAGKR